MIRISVFSLFLLFLISCGGLTPISKVDEVYAVKYTDDSDWASQLLFFGDELVFESSVYSVNQISLDDGDVRQIYQTDSNDPLKGMQLKGNRLLALSFENAAIFNAPSWELGITFRENVYEGLELSDSGDLIGLSEGIYRTGSGVLFAKFPDHHNASYSTFSSDDRFLVGLDITFSPFIMDLTNENNIRYISERLEFVDKVEFVSESTFMAYEVKKFGLHRVNVVTGDIESSYKSSQAIECWAMFGTEGGIALALTNKKLVILDALFEEVARYNLMDRSEHCVGGRGNELWLATESLGVVHLNLDENTWSNPIPLSNKIIDFVVSESERYFGVIEQSPVSHKAYIYQAN